MATEQGKGDKRRQGKGYDDAYDRIFGVGAKAKTSYSFIDRRTGKTVEVHDRNQGESGRVHILCDIEPFTSPVTGEVISSRSHLREHHKEHGTTDSRDYSPEWRRKKHEERSDRATCQTKEDKAHRIESLKRAVDKDRDKSRRR